MGARVVPPGVFVLAIVLGIALGGGGAVWWGQHQQATEPQAPAASTANGVRLVLVGVADGPPARARNGAPGPFWVDGALLHSRGPGTATVTRIHRPGDSLTIRVPALPVRLSRHHAYEPVRLGIAPRDCALATQWTPSAQPFTVTWEEGGGKVHAEPGGDHDGALEVSLVRLLSEACGRPPLRHAPARP